MLDDARREDHQAPPQGWCVDNPLDPAAPASSESAATTRPAQAPAPTPPAPVLVVTPGQQPPKTFELDGVVYEVRPVRRRSPPPRPIDPLTGEPAKLRRGLACVSPERRAEISAKGGRASQASGKVRHFSADEAREAGRKGGLARAQRHRELASDRAAE